MKFKQFKKIYTTSAKAETPNLNITPTVTEKSRVPFTETKGFTFAVTAFSLLLAVTIGMTALFTKGFTQSDGAIANSLLTPCASYDEVGNALKALSKENEDANYSDVLREFGDMLKSDSNLAVTAEGTDDSFSKTNSQVEGVDEGDIVKTDGKHVYFGKDNSVKVFNVENPAEIKKTSEINLAESLSDAKIGSIYISELYLDNSLLTVLYTAEADYEATAKKNEYVSNCSKIGVSVFDVSAPSAPKELRTSLQEGYIISSRRIGGYIYIASNRGISLYDYSGKPEEYIPHVFDSCTKRDYCTVPADSIYLPETPTVGFLTVSAIDIADCIKPMNSVTIMGSGCQVYSTASDFYIFCGQYRNENETDIYKFGIDGSNIALTATTYVTGVMINQFAADEYEGNLRVATTTNRFNNGTSVETNGITILDGGLNKLGELTGLAEGEHIYSVRFNGATGYVVTFRTVDPLFAFDLSDPANPKVTGELKVPGYSEYLHNYSDDVLIGLGQDAASYYEDDEVAYYQGLKVSLFNVGDELSEIDTYYLGDRGTFSDAEFDHKAFSYYPERDIFGFSVSLCRFADNNHDITEYAPHDSEGFYIFSPNGGSKITLVSVITQMNKYENETLTILRGLFIGDNVLTISANKIQFNKIADGTITSSLNF